jgi:O-Antigen ligase
MNEVEYLYDGTLRWGFGFENPNKAAVLFACLIPLLWAGWSASWGIARGWVRGICISLSAIAFLGAGLCLLMTFSRGGVVAAALAMGYLWIFGGEKGSWRGRMSGFIRPKGVLSLLLVAILVAVALRCGMAERSASGLPVLHQDASVMHRVDLWRGALQMTYENPYGFGAGHSGEQYMEWYQSLDRSEGYRTMVSSYLTLLVEQGWIVFGLGVGTVIALWRWSRPAGRYRGVILAMKASLIAFLVSGAFSTTMENPWLWILPVVCTLGLLLTVREHPSWGNILTHSVTGTLLLVGFLGLGGWYLAGRDPLVRTIGIREGQRGILGVSVQAPVTSVLVLTDPAVMGEQPGRLLRAMAQDVQASVILETTAKPEIVVATGVECLSPRGVDARGSRETFWIAPSIPVTPPPIREKIILLLPEIDEDGRSAWWKSHTDSNLSCVTLEGVGTRADSAWPQVIRTVRESIQKD